jgi:hypothetical protein
MFMPLDGATGLGVYPTLLRQVPQGIVNGVDPAAGRTSDCLVLYRIYSLVRIRIMELD